MKKNINCTHHISLTKQLANWKSFENEKQNSFQAKLWDNWKNVLHILEMIFQEAALQWFKQVQLPERFTTIESFELAELYI